MTRDDALDHLVQFAHTMLAPLQAELVARAFDRSLDSIGVEPKSLERIADERMATNEPGYQQRALVLKHGAARTTRAVPMDELAPRIAVAFGLFGGMDHAMQTPHFDSAVERVRYICGRSAVRLAWLFGDEEGVAALRERNPYLDSRIFGERFKPNVVSLGAKS